ncbi:MAG: hypothetical protein ACREIF_16720 [Chthoniobacterales bacterium]
MKQIAILNLHADYVREHGHPPGRLGITKQDWRELADSAGVAVDPDLTGEYRYMGMAVVFIPHGEPRIEDVGMASEY